MGSWPDVTPWRGLDAFDRRHSPWTGDHRLAPLGPVEEPVPWPPSMSWPDGAAPSARIVALDIETTGLGGAAAVAFQVGLAWREPDGAVHVRQFLAPDLPDEALLLERLEAELGREPTRLVTYNGDAFDLPFLRVRARMHGIRLHLPPALDLLAHTRRLYRDRDGSCRLGHLEATRLGHVRADDLPGALVPQVYYDFLRRQEESLLEPVLRHNAWDLVATLGLLWQAALDLHPDALVGRDGADLFGLFRALASSGDHAGARAALEACLRSDPSPALARQARRRLSALYRRGGDAARRHVLWREAAARAEAPPEHLVEWAKILEHELHDPAAALRVAQTAEVRMRAQARLMGRAPADADVRALERRITRLEHRLARQKARGRIS